MHALDSLMPIVVVFVRARSFGRRSGHHRLLRLLSSPVLGWRYILPAQPAPEHGTVVRPVTIPETPGRALRLRKLVVRGLRSLRGPLVETDGSRTGIIPIRSRGALAREDDAL